MLDIEINLASGTIFDRYVLAKRPHIACPIPRDLHITHASLGVVLDKVIEQLKQDIALCADVSFELPSDTLAESVGGLQQVESCSWLLFINFDLGMAIVISDILYVKGVSGTIGVKKCNEYIRRRVHLR